MSGISKPKNPISLAAITSPCPIPRNPKDALSNPNWKNAMIDEYNALIENKTWVRVDCDDTFSLVVKPAIIRTVLSLAVSKSWPIHQLDVKNAFLHGTLNETVYMHKPKGFRDSKHPDYVCLLNKSLYGLKQAPRALYQRFADFVHMIGFVHSQSDHSLFVYRKGRDLAYLLLYVDDIILTTSSDALRHSLIDFLAQEFAMKDLGPLNYFLGIAVKRHQHGLFLSQSQYASDILERAGMSSCKSSSTPVDTKAKLSANSGNPYSDPTHYRSLAGALQYLTFTRPDISYVVQQTCLHMHDPREEHMTALKRILRYVQGTLHYGLHLYKSPSSALVSYTDTDWGGCPGTHRSTSGYCVYLGDNLISWSSKRQPTLSRSSAEAEYRGVSNVVSESCWLRNLLLELHCPLQKATLVYCDNVSAIFLSGNPVQHQRTKHIEMDIHFVSEKVARGEVRILHVPSRYQIADIFTKGLPRDCLSIEDKLNYLEQPRPHVPVALEGQQVAPEIIVAHTAWIKGLKEIQAEHELLQTTRDFLSCKHEEGQSVSSLGKTVNELHAMLKLHEKTLPKNNAPALHVIRAGKVQKGNNKHKKHKGQNQGKGKNKLAYASNPKIPPPPKREDPAKDSICHEYGETGQWKRNCPQYLAELLKKKKNAASGAGGSGYPTCNVLEDQTGWKLRRRRWTGTTESLTSLDEGLYALTCEGDVRSLATLVRSFGVTALDYYIRPPRFRATIEDIIDEPVSIATNRTGKMLFLTWHESSEPTKEPVYDSVTPSSLPQYNSSTPCKDYVCESITPMVMPQKLKKALARASVQLG
ncbi:copia protein [Tanacetum coccineum]